MAETTRKMLENANKVGFIVQNYPDKNIDQVVASLQMPAIDINTAIWLAVELGFIEDPADHEGVMLLKNPSENWDLGADVEDLKTILVYTFHQLARKEQDLEENFMSNWTMGYTGHDVLIALKQLLNEKVLFTYQLTDPKDLKSTYTFYTLYENGEQMWGKKNFKEQPTGEEQPDTGDASQEENNA